MVLLSSAGLALSLLQGLHALLVFPMFSTQFTIFFSSFRHRVLSFLFPTVPSKIRHVPVNHAAGFSILIPVVTS